MLTKYRVVQVGEGWVVQIQDGLPVDLEGRRFEPEWADASEPFTTKEEAEREAERLKNE
jgi:hypothetical protein